MVKYPLQPFERRFITLAGELADAFSFSRSIGQLYGFLYIAPRPLSLQDIASACQMSKGNASIQLRTLEAWGAVERSVQLGTRQDFYVANRDIRSLAIRRLNEGITKRLAFVDQRIGSLKKEVSNGEINPVWKERIDEIEKLVTQSNKRFKLLMGFLK